MEEKIAREHNTGVERTIGYSDKLETLTREFGMGLEEPDSQCMQYPAGGKEHIHGQGN